MNLNRRCFSRGLVVASCLGITAVVHGQHPAWPTKPVRLLVGFPAGSTPDSSARALADGLATVLGQSVIVENRPGAAGNLAADLVSKAQDDHTLGVVINGNLTSAKMLNPNLAYDPARDFSFLSLLTTAPLALVARADLPEGAAFFEAAVQQGDRWNYGSVGAGSVAHLGMEQLKLKVPGLKAVHVPYQGNPAVLTALLGGQIHMALVPPGLAMPHVKSGRLQVIGLTGGRSTLVPELGALSELGVKNFNLEVWTALIGPSNLSKAAQLRLAQEVPAVVRSATTRQRLFSQGWNAVGSSPEGLRLRVADESAILGGIIRSANIKAE
ncbi:MAG: tripartite tricarboxylate transporter substrate binding protein [Betaproteobacteria bacterium]|nr:tripartite tricarboxylate transporter substrate binding protein [Betaproteobacteria bacterium]